MSEHKSPLEKTIIFLDSWDYSPLDVDINYTSGGFLDAKIDLGLNFKITIHAKSNTELDNFMACLHRMYKKEGMANDQ